MRRGSCPPVYGGSPEPSAELSLERWAAAGGPKVDNDAWTAAREGDDGVDPTRVGTVAVGVRAWTPSRVPALSDSIGDGDTMGGAEPVKEQRWKVGRAW